MSRSIPIGTSRVPESPSFAWTADQLQRYAFLRETVAALGLGRPVRLLDVGGAAPHRDGSLGWLPVVEVLRSSESLECRVTVLDKPSFSAAGYVRGDGRALPFRDGAFDVVSALDVLEHIPDPDRPLFLREMARVSADLVVLSGPARSAAVEEAERLVGSEIEKRYHIKHVQLAEHAAFGLISNSETRDALESGGAAVASLGFGSLASWTASQELRARYLLRRKSPHVLEKLDAFLSSRDVRREFEPPFYRMFWLASKIRTREDLDNLGETVRVRLLAAPNLAEEDRKGQFQEFVAAAEEMESEGMVSAVVVGRGNAEALEACLRRLFTQVVDFDLEIVVWDLSGGAAEADVAAGSFPSVRVVEAEPADSVLSGLRRIVSHLRGDAVLLIDETVHLPSGAAARLYVEKRGNPAAGVWAWRVPWKRFLTQSRSGRLLPGLKAAAGRIPRWRGRAEILSLPRSGWLYSRCLLFSMEALAARRPSDRKMGPRSLFLWP